MSSAAPRSHSWRVRDSVVCRDVQTAKERFSEGGSGAFMFMSSDQRFVVKTMSRSECHVLLDILEAYKTCVMLAVPHPALVVNPRALVCQVCGSQPAHLDREVLRVPFHQNVPAHHLFRRHGEHSPH